MCDNIRPPKKAVSLLLDQKLYDDLKVMAAQSGRSFPAYVRQALKLHLYIVSWLRH